MSRIFTRGTTTLIVCSHGIALFLEHMDDEQEPKISSEISPHINDKQLGRLNSYVEGGVTGAVGIVGIAIGTPAILTMGLRVIYKIGLCYGYEFNDEADKQFVLEK